MTYFFENCSLDLQRRELRRASQPVAIEPQVFDILHYLIRHRNRVVTKDDLIAAVWGGRIVSDSTLSSRITAVRRAVGDCGREQRLIRTMVRQGLRFVADVRERQADPASSAPLPGRDSDVATRPRPPMAPSEVPSIVVLPFANLAPGSPQDCLIEGIREDLTTAFTQLRWLSVVGRASRLTVDGRVADARDLGHELGVRYVLDGAVRTVDGRLRATARLVDAATGVHLCAQRFDERARDTFDLADRVSRAIVGATGPILERAEIERARRTPTERLDAYRCHLLGLGSVYRWTRGGIDEALRLFQSAIELDPEFAPAYGMAAYCYIQRKSYGWFADRPREVAESVRLARHAAELGGDDAATLTRAAHAVASVGGDLDSGLVFVEQALRCNPNLATAWYVSGWMKLYRGEPKAAAECLVRAISMSPSHPLVFKMHSAIAYAHFFLGHYDAAATAAENALRTRPHYLTATRAAAASHALAGRAGKAQSLMAHMRHCDPALRMSNLSQLMPFHRAADVARWHDGLHRAGLPG